MHKATITAVPDGGVLAAKANIRRFLIARVRLRIQVDEVVVV